MQTMEEELTEELWKDYEELTKKQMEQCRFNTQKALDAVKKNEEPAERVIMSNCRFDLLGSFPPPLDILNTVRTSKELMEKPEIKLTLEQAEIGRINTQKALEAIANGEAVIEFSSPCHIQGWHIPTESEMESLMPVPEY